MKLTILCEGPGWGSGTSGAMELDARPFMLQYKRGETLTLNVEKGSGEDERVQKRIKQGVFTVVSAPKPAA